jgi:hypothetical protein
MDLQEGFLKRNMTMSSNLYPEKAALKATKGSFLVHLDKQSAFFGKAAPVCQLSRPNLANSPRDAQRFLPQQQSGLRASFRAFLFQEDNQMPDPV